MIFQASKVNVLHSLFQLYFIGVSKINKINFIKIKYNFEYKISKTSDLSLKYSGIDNSLNLPEPFFGINFQIFLKLYL